ncbi:hypothetical protein Q5530_12255 [Saccharothrix sp. BKS2]|uniref:hypothetical protein n=1 Tax=Saccharothrix sp. BKS2 TaxID=3064400 RepID=UPI0039EAFC6F
MSPRRDGSLAATRLQAVTGRNRGGGIAFLTTLLPLAIGPITPELITAVALVITNLGTATGAVLASLHTRRKARDEIDRAHADAADKAQAAVLGAARQLAELHEEIAATLRGQLAEAETERDQALSDLRQARADLDTATAALREATHELAQERALRAALAKQLARSRAGSSPSPNEGTA